MGEPLLLALYIWLSNSISWFVAEQNPCNILQGTLLFQRSDKTDGVQKGNHLFGLSGIPYLLLSNIAKLAIFVLCDYCQMLVEIGVDRIIIRIFQRNDGDAAFLIKAADVLHQMAIPFIKAGCVFSKQWDIGIANVQIDLLGR